MTPHLPVMLMVSTASSDQGSYQPEQIQKAAAFLVSRGAKVNAVVMSTHPGDVNTAAALTTSVPAIIAAPVAKATSGRFEALPVASRLAALLPEWGRDLATLHARQIKQFRVTAERARSGDLQNPRIELTRQGLTGTVTRDGYLP